MLLVLILVTVCIDYHNENEYGQFMPSQQTNEIVFDMCSSQDPETDVSTRCLTMAILALHPRARCSIYKVNGKCGSKGCVRRIPVPTLN